MKNVIGIDLGTTNCCVAIVENGRPKVIEDEKGYNILPSYIAVKGPNRFIVGHGAKAQAISSPKQTLRAVKRLIGRKINTPEVEEARKRMGYDIIEGQNLDVLLQLEGVVLTPVEASSVLLKCIKGIAERYLGREVTEAVITCPAYFTNAQRKATIEAGQKAGLRVLRLLNEPTAAALAYGYKKDINKKILIYDLGGGTFDVSILEIGNNVYEVLATNGDSYLGGEDFDNRVVDHLAANFKAQHKIELRSDANSLQRLKDAAERAKCELSFVDKTQVMIPHIHGTVNLQAELSREVLEKLTEDLVQQTFAVVARTLEEANIQGSNIDDIILVGGQTRMPRIQELVKSFFGRPACKGVHPDEAVAVGAAVHADSLTEDRGDMLLLDVTPFSLGIDSAGDVFTRIVAKNSTIPVSESRTFTTVIDNQEKVKIVVRQGENKRATENAFLGEFVLTGIRRAPKMEPKIDVVFRIDSNGILNVSAKDRSTGERQSILIKDYFELATNPEHFSEHQPGAEGEAAVDEAGGEDRSVGGRARGLFRRLVGGLSRKRDSLPSTEAPAPIGEGAGLELDETAEAGAPAGLMLDERPEQESADLAPPLQAPAADAPLPPRPSAATYDPYSVVPVHIEPDAVESKTSEAPRPTAPTGRTPKGFDQHPPPPVAPTPGNDPFARPHVPRTFTGQYTDPFAMLDKSGAFPSGSDPFSMASSMPDPFALDGVDPFAVQEKQTGPAKSAGRTPTVSQASPGDALASLDLDKLVDELNDGMPTLSRGMDDLPVPKSPLTLSKGPGDESNAALSASGVDPFALLPDGTMPEGYATQSGFHRALDDIRNLPDTTVASKLPSSFIEDTGNLPSGFIQETGNLPSGFIPEATHGSRAPENASSLPEPPRAAAGKKKPAKLKIAYKRIDAFVSEYSENLNRGGTFIKTPSPLDLGRECLFELTIPNREQPIYLNGVVVWSSKGMNKLEEGQEPGMGIKYLFPDNGSRRTIELILDELRTGA